jgi:hypothetical protein
VAPKQANHHLSRDARGGPELSTFAEVSTAQMLAGVAVIVGAGLWLTRMELRAAREERRG